MSTHLPMDHQIHVSLQRIAKVRDYVHLLDGAGANRFVEIFYLMEYMIHHKKLVKEMSPFVNWTISAEEEQFVRKDCAQDLKIVDKIIISIILHK